MRIHIYTYMYVCTNMCVYIYIYIHVTHREGGRWISTWAAIEPLQPPKGTHAKPFQLVGTPPDKGKAQSPQVKLKRKSSAPFAALFF